MLGAAQTRESFWGLGLGLKVLWYVLATASVVVFAYGIARLVAKYRLGRSGSTPPLSELPRRFAEAGRRVASHATVAHRSPYVGWAHRGLFYGFLTLFVGT